MKQISMSMTTEAVRNRTKTVTRRLGWWSLKPGDLLQAVERGMGLKKGEHVVKLAVIRVRLAFTEPLRMVFYSFPDEMAREGFPDMDPFEFADMFMSHNHCNLDTPVNRIEFEYVEATP